MQDRSSARGLATGPAFRPGEHQAVKIHRYELRLVEAPLNYGMHNTVPG